MSVLPLVFTLPPNLVAICRRLWACRDKGSGKETAVLETVTGPRHVPDPMHREWAEGRDAPFALRFVWWGGQANAVIVRQATTQIIG